MKASKSEKLELLVSDSRGRIFSVPRLEGAGMKGGRFFRLTPKELVRLPSGSEVFMLPDRLAVGYSPQREDFALLERSFAVAAFISPGYTATFNASYKEISKTKMLPLFSYAAAVVYKGELCATAIKVDSDIRHDSRFIDMGQVKKNAARLKNVFSRNRLVRHLERCALIYGCPNAQNFFLSRYEAPLPVSPRCNAACSGCISYQPHNKCPVTQPRIGFIPAAEEVVEIALFHIKNARDPIVSFGQGCEGEPLVAAGVILKSITAIRRKTAEGVININTNASFPKAIAGLFDAGLDSMRVSLNSAREEYYARYYKPGGYNFKDVMDSVKIAKRKRGYVSINYLTMPGFTDSRDEFEAFQSFIEKYRIDMVQWRNLNFDPLRYFRELKVTVGREEMLGIRRVMKMLKIRFPYLKMGYFNPSRI